MLLRLPGKIHQKKVLLKVETLVPFEPLTGLQMDTDFADETN